MITEVFSYRFAEEIIQHGRHRSCWDEIMGILKGAPVYTFPNKSASNSKLDVVQQLMNTYFDRIFSVEKGWEYHPLATNIPESRLAADYKKCFGNVTIQAEVQFGNMARWYSDIFKFQTAYSQGLIDIGLSIVPTLKLASRIDSNIANYERVIRELPSAKLSITLPILVIGIEPDERTSEIDVSETKFSIKEITGKSKSENRYRIINASLHGIRMNEVDEKSETGVIPKGTVAVDEDVED